VRSCFAFGRAAHDVGGAGSLHSGREKHITSSHSQVMLYAWNQFPCKKTITADSDDVEQMEVVQMIDLQLARFLALHPHFASSVSKDLRTPMSARSPLVPPLPALSNV
jgi:hypothetical protein